MPFPLLKKTPFLLLTLLMLLLAAGTVVEHCCGTPAAHRLVYVAPWTCVLWGLTVLAGLWHIVRRWARVGWAVRLLHFALILILSGAMLTHLTGKQGRVELLEGAAATDAYEVTATGAGGETTHRVGHFPFRIRLLSGRTEYYPGTVTPMDFVYQVEVADLRGDEPPRSVTVTMNHILDHRHWRFYPAMQSPGRAVFTVSHDPWGIGVTYAGYVLLVLGMTAWLLCRGGTFRTLLRSLARRQAVLAGLCFLPLLAVGAHATAAEPLPTTVQPGLAAEFGRLHVYYKDRVCPLRTLARDFCTKLTGQPSYRGLSDCQVLMGWLLYYDEWKREPMIRIKDKDVAAYLGAVDGRVRLIDFYDHEGAKLGKVPAALSERAVREADEKCRLVAAVCTGALLRIYPYRAQPSAPVEWLSWVDELPRQMSLADRRFVRGSMPYVAENIYHGHNVSAAEGVRRIRDYQVRKAGAEALPTSLRFQSELLLHHLSRTRAVATGSLVVGLLLFLLAARRSAPRVPSFLSRILRFVPPAMVCLLLSWTLVVLFLRGYVGGYFPVSNGYETLLALTSLLSFAGLAVSRHHRMAVPALVLTLGGMALMAASWSEANPVVTHLMPVLSSPLLSVHVLTILVGYACLMVAAGGSLASLLRDKFRSSSGVSGESFLSIRYSVLWVRALLCLAVYFLGIGILLGAVWANQSWGTYWSWDPKETWALVTWIVYALPLHRGSLPCFSRPRFLLYYVLFGFISVLITYFGVNYFLGGLHSYA